MLFYALITAIKQQFIPTSDTLTQLNVTQDSKLTIEIFQGIMKYLPMIDCVKLLRLCKSWSGLAAEAFYQSPPYHDGLLHILHLKEKYHPYELFIKELKFMGQTANESTEILMGDLQDLIKLCPNVISLKLDSFWNLSNLLPNILSDSLPFLSRIELPGCQVGNNFVLQLIRKVYTLRYIDLSFTNVTLDILPLIIRECLYLDSLDMTGTKNGDEKSVQDYEASEYFLVGDSLKKFKSFLTQISLSNTKCTDDMIKYVAKHCPSLQRIFLNNCLSVTDASVYSIAMHCHELKELDLGYCLKITDIGIQSLAIHFSSHFELLQYHNLTRQTEKSKRRVKSMSSLDSCLMSRNYESQSDYQPVLRVSNQAQLEKINLTNMTFLSHSSVCLLASKCPNLYEIILDGCDNVIDWYNPWIHTSVDSTSTIENFHESNSFHSAESRYHDCHPLTLTRVDILERLDSIKKLR